MSEYIERIVKRLVDSGLAADHQIRGCSESEINSLEWDMGVRFPNVYRQFMYRMGRGAGRLFQGTDVFWGRVRELREHAAELLAESSAQFVLPENAHVFCMHQGYVFLYFIADGGDDPAVFQYVENEQEARCVDESFSQFLDRSVDEARQMEDQLESFRSDHGLKRD